MIGTLQKIAIVQCYILHKTDKMVQIKHPKNINEIILLDQAYDVSKQYLIL